MTLPGFITRFAGDSIPVLTLHYRADPRKRPGTPEGDAWLQRATSGYPGGVNSPRWQKEMEISYDALGGTLVFPDFARWATGDGARIVIPPVVPQGGRIYGTYDHGWRNPAAFHLHWMAPDGRRITFYEAYGARIPVSKMAKIITGAGASVPDERGRMRHFPAHPHFREVVWLKADPQLWEENQSMSDGPNKAVADLFRQHGVYFQKAHKGGDAMVAQWVLGDFWADPMAPLWQITTDCPKLVWELGRLRNTDVSATVAINKDQPETIVDKDNHGWDDCKFFHREFPPTPRERSAAKAPGSFEWFRQQAIQTKTGAEPKTFRVGQRQMVG